MAKDGECEGRGDTECFEARSAAEAPAVKRKAGGAVALRSEGGAAARRHDRPGRKRAEGGPLKPEPAEDLASIPRTTPAFSAFLKQGGDPRDQEAFDAFRNKAPQERKSGGATKWVAGAHLKKGAFTKQAESAGEGVHEYAEEKKAAPGKTGKRARLALTFENMRHKK